MKFLTMAQAATEVGQLTGVPRTRATIYNWAKKGVGPGKVKLQTEPRAGQLFTTDTWVAEFLSRIDQK
jgi:hypothetical protein